MIRGEELIKLVRGFISSYLEDKNFEISDEIKEKYKEERGVFVTLTIDGELRGCIGIPEPIMPLYKGVIEAAEGAAFRDPRFEALSKDEFKRIKIEISVLTKSELIEVKKAEEYLEKIKVGEDGLIIRGSFCSGLLLPQVAVEQIWGVKEFLEYICLKAGLGKGDWRNLNNKIYKFQAEIFKED